MRRKGLLKQVLAITLSAAMTMGSMSTMAFASEEAETEWGGGVSQSTEVTAPEDALDTAVASETTDVLQETAEQEETQIQEEASQEQDEDVIVQVETDALTEDAVVIDNNADALELDMGDANVAVIADETDATPEASTPTQEEKDAARKYLEDTYITGTSKIMSNGGSGVTKSADGLTYTIGLKSSATDQYGISSMRLYVGSTYTPGWYIDSTYVGKEDPSYTKSRTLYRPEYGNGDGTFTVKLRLFKSGTEASVINDEASAAQMALVEQDFTFILKQKDPVYTMTINVQDEEKKAIDDATVALTEGYYTTVSPSADGSYTLTRDASYTLKVTKDGYNDYTETFTFSPSEINTVKTVTLKELEYQNITFKVTNQTTGDTVAEPQITLKDGNSYSSKKVIAESDGSYKLIKGKTYYYTVTATDYKSATGSFTVGEDTSVSVSLEPIVYQKVAFHVTDASGEKVTDATITVRQGTSSYGTQVTAESDGSYKLIKGDTYNYTVTATDYHSKTAVAFTVGEETEITVSLEKIEYVTINFQVTDTAGKEVKGATIKVYQSWTPVNAQADGSYKLVKGTKYNYSVTATNYTSISDVYFTPEANETITVALTKNILYYTVFFKAQDPDGKAIEDAKVTVKSYYNETQQADGSYSLSKWSTYTYTIEAEGYKTATGSYKPSGDDEVITVPVTMEKDVVDVTECKVTIQVVDSETQAVIDNPIVKVIYYAYDEYYQTFSVETVVSPNDDKTYTMTRGVEYTYTISTEGYTGQTGTYTPDGKKEADTLTVSLVKVPEDTPDQRAVDAIKEKMDASGTLYPKYATDKNILEVVKTRIAGYTDVDTTGVTVSLKSSDATDWIGTDGTIHYRAQDPEQWGINSKNVDLVFVFEKNGATAETESRIVVGWDVAYYNQQIETDHASLTWDKIKGSNTEETAVTSDLNLVRCMTSNMRTAWSTITWTSSNTDVISIEKPSTDSPIYPATGKITQPTEDTQVTLTATFAANDVLLNDRVEKVSDFTTLTKTFTVTVKGSGEKAPTEAELQAILDKYYTADQIKKFGTDTVADLNNCTTDLQLIRYTKIKDGEDLVFENKEITVTSDNDALKVDAYHAYVDRFTSDKDVTANLIVTFTRKGVTVEKKIPVTVKPITEEELSAELKMMEVAKAHYFDGINDGRYVDKDSITGDLHAFQKMILDEQGSPKWIYNKNDTTGNGIIADTMIEDSWEMEGAGYRAFKSSNNAVVQHDNLVVTRPTADTQITISSMLTSETYKTQAEAHPDNERLQKLYKQEVSVTVTVKGTESAKTNLTNKITEAKTLLETIVEGNGAGEYPAGTKEKLQNAITAAETVLNAESSTEEEFSQALKDLTQVVDAVKASQNMAEATVVTRIGTETGKDMDVSTMTVRGDVAASYGYTKPETCAAKVTTLDVLVAWHAAKYGEAFQNDPTAYLQITQGWITKINGITTMAAGILVNNKMPGSSLVNEAVVETGDTVTVFVYGDTSNYKDLYLYFEGLTGAIHAGEPLELTLYGYHAAGSDEVKAQEGYTVAALDAAGNQVASAVTDANGKITLKLETEGTYEITVTKTPETSTETAYILPTESLTFTLPSWDKGEITKEATCAEEGIRTYTCSICHKTKTEAIPATGQHTMVTVVDRKATCGKAGSEHQECSVCHGNKSAETVIPATGKHAWGEWKVTKAATALAKGVQTRSCNVCGEKQTQEIAKLSPKMTLSASSVSLKLKQSTTALKVTGMETGDYLKSVTVKDSSYATVTNINKNGTFKLTAKNKAGSTTLTVTLASGLKKTVTVKVQKKAVTTTKITGLQSKVTVKKGAKLTLKPTVTPVTSTQKFTYTTSNKKVATVSSKGVITAKAAGTAKITVKSGSKKVVVTVAVPKTKTTAITVKTAVTVKKGKTIALGAKKTPANSDEKITYTSANKKIATVSSAGKIKGIKKGTTTITVKSGNITKKIKVTVK